MLSEYGISTEDRDLKEALLQIEKADFYKRFMKLMSLMLQMRNSDEKEGIDEIISPVMNKNGYFFVSGKDAFLPLDADANGAYNIAKKGLWAVRKIKETPTGELAGIKLAISNKEWLRFAQETCL